MKIQPETTRAFYMAKAREARKAREDYLDGRIGYLPRYHPVDHYVRGARRANRQVVLSKMWRNNRV